jgi:hypothetical protein
MFYTLRQAKIVEALKLKLGYTPIEGKSEIVDEDTMVIEDEDLLITMIEDAGAEK